MYLPQALTPCPPRVAAGVVWCCFLAAATLLGACAPPTAATPGAAASVAVLSLTDGRLVHVRGDRVVGHPVDAGAAPWQMALGSHGGALFLSLSAGQSGEVTFTPSTTQESAALPRPLSLERGAMPALVAAAGDQGVVLYRTRIPGQDARLLNCRLALIDLRAGEVMARQTVCRPWEQVLGLAVVKAATAGWGDGAALVAYLSVWSAPWEAADAGGLMGTPAGGRIVTVDATTGHLLAAAPIDGVPAALALAPAIDVTGPHLLAGVASPAPDASASDRDDVFSAASHWQVVCMEAGSLSLDRTFAPGGRVQAMTASTDGRRGYALIGKTLPQSRASVVAFDLRDGRSTDLGPLPGRAVALAADDSRVYVPSLDGGELWVINAASGRIVRHLRVGQHPVAVALLDGGRSR